MQMHRRGPISIINNIYARIAFRFISVYPYLLCFMWAYTCFLISTMRCFCVVQVLFFKETFIHKSRSSKGRPPSLQTSKTKLSCFLPQSSGFNSVVSTEQGHLSTLLSPQNSHPFIDHLYTEKRLAIEKNRVNSLKEWGDTDERSVQMMFEREGEWRTRERKSGETEPFSDQTRKSGTGWVHNRHLASTSWLNDLGHPLNLGYNTEERRQSRGEL